jgi:hypothetical protein
MQQAQMEILFILEQAILLVFMFGHQQMNKHQQNMWVLFRD